MSSNDEAKESYLIKKTTFFIVSIIILIILILLFAGYLYVSSGLKPVNKDDTSKVKVEVPLGSSTSNIAELLEDKNLIKNANIFNVYVKVKNENDFQAGNYELSPSQTIDEIIEELQSGKLIKEALHKITIPEGKSLEQIAEIYSNNFEFTKEEFIKAASNEKFIKELQNLYPNTITTEVLKEDIRHPLEGYLFASTYEFFEEEPEIKEIITDMVERTDKHVTEELSNKKVDFTVHEILTLASVIERESKFDKDRSKVSQVFINRMKSNMKLQSDITASYALGKHQILMSYDDIAVESPYNTYSVEGLPIGPIASPSIESIRAAIKPEGKEFTKEYFYARPSGETLYSSTLEEHSKIKKQYEHEWQELNKDDKKSK